MQNGILSKSDLCLLYGFHYQSSKHSKLVLLRDKYDTILLSISITYTQLDSDLFIPKKKVEKFRIRKKRMVAVHSTYAISMTATQTTVPY